MDKLLICMSVFPIYSYSCLSAEANSHVIWDFEAFTVAPHSHDSTQNNVQGRQPAIHLSVASNETEMCVSGEKRQHAVPTVKHS